MTEIESRSVPFTMTRAASGDGLTLAGYAAVFNSPAMIRERGQEFEEQIAPGAFHRAVNSGKHVVMQWNHGHDPAIGATPLGKIEVLREDEHGLYVEAKLNSAEQFAGVRQAIADQAITGMSFRFSVPENGDEWDHSGEVPKRTIRSVFLHELGPVAYPAYDTTSVAIRAQFKTLDDDRQLALLEELRSQARPEEGSPEDEARPEEGSRTRTRTQRKALAALHNI